MTNARAALARALPVLLLLALYWPAVTGWFFQDDFGWLNLRHDVHSVHDLGVALFAPKAHGNMRPLGENAWWLLLPTIFGPRALPMHLAAFLTQAGSLLLLGSIVARLTRSRVAAFSGQILWIANVAIAEALGWSSIFNQILSGFFFLLAFYFLLRYAESHRSRDWTLQWVAFLLGLGALEINVVYPALAAAWALLFARPSFRKLFRKLLPMFAVSAFAILVHFHFAPAASSGVYAPVLDGRVFSTVAAYWLWALGPVPLALALALTAAIALLIVRQPAALLGLAWFLFPLLPYLTLPDHKMDYYLVVPAIGIAMLGAFAINLARTAPWRILTAICLLAYLGFALPKSVNSARWEHARGERLENLADGVEEARRQAPGKIILLEGIDTDFFWSGMADLPFRALAIPHVYLAPSEFDTIHASRDLLSKYILPPALARRTLDDGEALLFRFDGQKLQSATPGALADEDQPHFVNIADSVFHDYLGQGWSEGPRDLRSMNGPAMVRIGGPRTASDHLYIGVFDTHAVHLTVTANGVELPLELAFRNLDLSEYRATLPAAALDWKWMQVSLKADRAPLLFGYLEVR